MCQNGTGLHPFNEGYGSTSGIQWADGAHLYWRFPLGVAEGCDWSVFNIWELSANRLRPELLVYARLLTSLNRDLRNEKAETSIQTASEVDF